MTPNEYQKAAMRTASGKCYDCLNAALGIAGEAGEVADYIKKCGFQGHRFDEWKLKEELGDVLWYVALMADIWNISLEEVMEDNIEKLKKRYPEGFSAERSIHRTEVGNEHT